MPYDLVGIRLRRDSRKNIKLATMFFLWVIHAFITTRWIIVMHFIWGLVGPPLTDCRGSNMLQGGI